MGKNETGTVVLFSGGIDSTVCLKLLIDQKISLQALFIDYGQASSDREATAVTRLANHYDIPLEKIQIKEGKNFSSGFIRGRNAFLVMSALMYSKYQAGTITLGIHKGTEYKDCSSKFIHILQDMVDLYCDEQIRVDAPLLNFSKDEIWQLAKNRKIPVDLTYSCELGLDQPCDKCKSCQDLKKLYEL